MNSNLPGPAQAFLDRYCEYKKDGIYVLTRGHAFEFEGGLRVFDEDGNFECDIKEDRSIETN